MSANPTNDEAEISALIEQINEVMKEETALREKLQRNEVRHVELVAKLEKSHASALEELAHTHANVISQLMQDIVQPMIEPPPRHTRARMNPRNGDTSTGEQMQRKWRSQNDMYHNRQTKHEHAYDFDESLANPATNKEKIQLISHVRSLPLFNNPNIVDPNGRKLKSTDARWELWIKHKLTTIGDIFDREGNVMWSSLFAKFGNKSGSDLLHEDLTVLAKAVPSRYRQILWDHPPEKLK